MSTTSHTTPLRSMPAWAVLQRRLFDEIEDARQLFVERYTNPDGSLRGIAAFADRDGVDDLYEPFFNWPAFYLLGGPDAALSDAKRHWEGVTAQLSAAGMLTDEYENGYDWFHQAAERASPSYSQALATSDVAARFTATSPAALRCISSAIRRAFSGSARSSHSAIPSMPCTGSPYGRISVSAAE